MKIKLYGLRSFIIEDGIVEIFATLEKTKDGHKLLFIDRIDIHGSIELSELRTILRRIHRQFKEKYHIF